MILVWRPNPLPFDESYVESGGVGVDELEKVDLEGERGVKAGLSSVQLLLCQPLCSKLVEEVEGDNEDEVDDCTGGCNEDAIMALKGLVHCGESKDESDPVEDNCKDKGAKKEDEGEDYAPGEHHPWKLHSPERWIWLLFPSDNVLLSG